MKYFGFIFLTVLVRCQEGQPEIKEFNMVKMIVEMLRYKNNVFEGLSVSSFICLFKVYFFIRPFLDTILNYSNLCLISSLLGIR